MDCKSSVFFRMLYIRKNQKKIQVNWLLKPSTFYFLYIFCSYIFCSHQRIIKIILKICFRERDIIVLKFSKTFISCIKWLSYVIDLKKGNIRILLKHHIIPIGNMNFLTKFNFSETLITFKEEYIKQDFLIFW